jgi:hypothetical protein
MADSQDYLKQAEEAMRQAETLVGTGNMSDREFLESVSHSDELMDHPDCMTEAGTCGFCMTLWCGAEAARKLLADGDVLNGIDKWTELRQKMWHDSKYYKFYQEEKAAGRNPEKSFEERGWEM